MRQTLLVLALSALAATSATAHDLVEARGRRVKVFTAAGRTEGTLTAFDDERVWVRTRSSGGSAVPIARRDITVMETPRSTGGKLGFAAIGAGAGLLTGMFWSLGEHHCNDDNSCSSLGKTLGVWFGSAAVVGTGTWLFTRRGWEDVDDAGLGGAGEAALQVTPVRGGVAVALRLRF